MKGKVKTNLTKEEIYSARKKILGYLYEARIILGGTFPWTKIRISDFYNTNYEGHSPNGTLAIAWMDHEEFHVNEDWINSPYLKEIVWHELLHTWLKVDHDKDCPLMRKEIGDKPLSDKELIKCLMKYK